MKHITLTSKETKTLLVLEDTAMYTAKFLFAISLLGFRFTKWFLWKSKRMIALLLLVIFIVYTSSTLGGTTVYAPTALAIAPVEILTSQQEQIKALMIAKCESGLRPNALNDNTTWGGVSQDLGVFQINKKYQGVTNPSFLYDWKINTLMAKQIFDGRGNWSAWSCARTLGL